MKLSCPIVDIHASWLALNPIHGCPFSCKYCFLNGVGNTKRLPNVLCSEEEAVDKLLNFELYNSDMPLCLFTSTDIFSTKSNIEYAMNILKLFDEKNIRNPIVMITKCFIPDYFIELVDELESKGMKFIFMLSYSGLDSSIERGINHDNIRNNFINLSNKGKTIIHYWRPFIPQNSNDEKLNEIINFVKKYAKASVAIGLKVQSSYIDKFDFWPEIIEKGDIAINSEAIWTKNAYEKIYNTKHFDYPIFRSTSCAISYVLNKPDYNCYYGSKICELNNCNSKQKELCKKKYENLDTNEIDKWINNVKDLCKIDFQYELDVDNRVIFIDSSLATSSIMYIKYFTGCDVKCNRKKDDYYWSTGHVTSKDLII